MNIEKKSFVGIVIVYSLLLVGALIVALAGPSAVARATSLAAPNGTVMYAKPGGLTSGACDTWGNACELSYALSSSVAGQEIWVAQGVYTPTATTTDRSATFQLKSGVAVYGGFAMTETLRTERDPAANVTVLSGDIDHNDVVDAQGVVTTSANIRGINSYHVVTGATGVTLDGVTITAGNANAGSSPHYFGGGMYNNGSSPTLTNVTFSGNAALGGGGMYNGSSSPTLSNVIFSGNSADTGGGMVNYQSSSPTLINVIFSDNAAYGGGGMFNLQSSPTLTNVTFSGNTAANNGGGECSTGTPVARR